MAERLDVAKACANCLLCPEKPREVVLFENTTKLISFHGVWRMEHIVLLSLYDFRFYLFLKMAHWCHIPAPYDFE
jgi:hypothetical protein